MTDEASDHEAGLIVPVGDGLALAFGPAPVVSSLGTKIETVPDALTSIAAANAAVQSYITAMEWSGHFVRLSSESVAALQEFGPTADSLGRALGVVRGSGGQFAHVVRFESLTALGSIAALGPAITGLALQLQLQHISSQLTEISGVVERIDRERHHELAAEITSTLKVLLVEVEAFKATGCVTDTQ